MKSNIPRYRQLFDLLKHSPLLLVGLVVVSLLATFTEGLGIGLILPLLNDSPLQITALGKIPFLESSNLFIGEMDLMSRIRLAAIVLVLIVFMRSVFSYVSQVLAVYLQANTERRLQEQIFRQILAVQISFIHGERQGDLLETLMRHTRQLGSLILSLANGLIHCFTVIAYVGLALLISWQLTLIAIALLLVLVRLTYQGFSVRINQLSRKQEASGLRFMSFITEQLSALHLTHLFAQEKHSLDRFMTAQQEYYGYYVRANQLVSLSRPLFRFLSTLALGILLFLGTFLLDDHSKGGLGQIALFLVIAFRLMAPVSSLNQVKAQMDNLSPYLRSVIDFIRREDKPYLKNGDVHFEGLKTGIVFKNVTFKYHADEGQIIKDVTIDIPKGKMVAVIGPSGAGKSTLVHLVTRLYDAEKGSILVDGTDLRNFDLTSWRSQLAVISQDVFLFNNTVRANLKFSKIEASDKEMYHAAELAQAHDFIMELPEGYDTMLGDRGVRLSGGQKQRIAIARAMLVDPQLLILDEATSDLDSTAEQAIQAAIEKYRQSRTMLVVAHRLSTIRKADSIIVLDAGAVIEQGTHEELLLKRGYYCQLLKPGLCIRKDCIEV